MAYSAAGLAAYRDQIMANVSIAYPLMAGAGQPARNNSSGEPYTIITRKIESRLLRGGQYEAIVVCGPNNAPFVGGKLPTTQREALMNLLDATSLVVGNLYTWKGLPTAEQAHRVDCEGVGWYVATTI